MSLIAEAVRNPQADGKDPLDVPERALVQLTATSASGRSTRILLTVAQAREASLSISGAAYAASTFSWRARGADLYLCVRDPQGVSLTHNDETTRIVTIQNRRPHLCIVCHEMIGANAIMWREHHDDRRGDWLLGTKTRICVPCADVNVLGLEARNERAKPVPKEES